MPVPCAVVTPKLLHVSLIVCLLKLVVSVPVSVLRHIIIRWSRACLLFGAMHEFSEGILIENPTIENLSHLLQLSSMIYDGTCVSYVSFTFCTISIRRVSQHYKVVVFRYHS